MDVCKLETIKTSEGETDTHTPSRTCWQADARSPAPPTGRPPVRKIGRESVYEKEGATDLRGFDGGSDLEPTSVAGPVSSSIWREREKTQWRTPTSIQFFHAPENFCLNTFIPVDLSYLKAGQPSFMISCSRG